MAKPLAQETVDRLAKLIPRLATDHDGEIIATVRAIRRTLASADVDLHDLAASLGSNNGAAPTAAEKPQPYDHRSDEARYYYRPPKPPPRREQPPATDDEKFARNIVLVATRLLEGEYVLTPSERDFLGYIRRQARSARFHGLELPQELELATIIKKCFGVDYNDWKGR